VISAVDHANMMEVLNRGMDNVSTVLQYCIQNVKLRLQEALHLFQVLNREIGDAAATAARILPRMVDSSEARSFMMQVINFDRVALKRLEISLGNALLPIIGVYNGYYSLDLSIANDRMCMSKILGQNQHAKDEMQKKCIFNNGTTGDLSQVGDWSSFRNERVNDQAIRISTELFNPMPNVGLVSFDFCGDSKAPREVASMKDPRCVNIIMNLGLVDRKDKDKIEDDLSEMNLDAARVLPGDGHYLSVNDKKRAEDIQLCMYNFYMRQNKRAEELIASKILEEEVIEKAFFDQLNAQPNDLEDNSDDDSVESLSHCVFQDEEKEYLNRQINIPDDLIEMTALTRTQQSRVIEAKKSSKVATGRRRGALAARQDILDGDSGDEADDGVDALPTAAIQNKALRDRHKSILGKSPPVGGPQNTKKQSVVYKITNSRKFVYQSSQALLNVKRNNTATYNAKCSKIVNALIDIVTRVYIKARHLAVILKHFRLGRTHKTRHFGTYRVELFIALYSRVVDIHNLYLVLAVMSPFEVACINCRLGLLHLFNPMLPEGCICLDLARREERIVAKILSLLSTFEPGENWLDESFRWEYTAVVVPGWQLTHVRFCLLSHAIPCSHA
jgi:hypothetical protein